MSTSSRQAVRVGNHQKESAFDDSNANSGITGCSIPVPNNPAAAAQYAVESMGFYLVHADSEGRHYLAAHWLDTYSLVYTLGEQGDHISYVVRCADDLLAAEKRFTNLGVKTLPARCLA